MPIRITSLLAVLTLWCNPALAQPTQEQIKSTMQHLEEQGRRGQAVVVLGGEMIYGGAIGDAAEGRPIEGDTLFYIGSVAKVFTSIAVLKLDDTGRLDIDDPITAYYPDLEGDVADVTLRMLLCHRAGFDANHPDPISILDREQFEAWALQCELHHEPDTTWAYSNVGYSLIAAIIERVTQRPYQEVIRELVLKPAGMENTFFLTDDFDTERLARGSGSSLEQHKLTGRIDDMEWTWLRAGAGGMVSTASDLMKLDRGIKAETVMSAQLLERAIRPEGTATYGLGWRLSDTGSGVHYHDGGFPGFSAEFIRLPQYDGAIIVLSNHDGDARRIRKAIESAG